MNRKSVIIELAQKIKAIKRPHIVKVAIDGLMASGKTTISAELSSELVALGLNPICCSVDDFFNNRETRYSRGFDSAIGCYQDTIDIKGLTEAVIEPLGFDGNGTIKTAIFDSEMNRPTESIWINTEPNDILIFEGIFLQKPELIDYWDLRIFIRADSDTLLSRVLKRDLKAFNSNSIELLTKHKKRYIPAQEIYIKEVSPELIADIVIDNNNYDTPYIVTN